MKHTKLFSLVLFFFIAATFKLSAQVSVTSYSIHALGTSLAISDKFDAELKLFANRWDFEDIGVEVSGQYKFAAKPYHQFSAGVGFGLAPYSGEGAFVSIPVALEIFPLQDFKRLSLVFELTPEIYLDYDDANLRHLWGIRYTFTKE